MASRADPRALYEASVQDTGSDIRLVVRAFRKRRGRQPLRLREDFCGTARLCADWVRRRPDRRAVGVDLDRETLAWGEAKHLAPLGPARARVRLLRQDVRAARGLFDVVLAFNFSYSVFKERRELAAYFRAVRRSLVGDGAFFLDLYGGPEAQKEGVEKQRFDGYDYVWEQEPLDAVSGWGRRHIHFRFPDGSERRRAFTYDWRLWSLPELRELLAEAGFAGSDVYWEGARADGSGNGIFRPVRRVANEESWIAYLVGWR